MTEQVRSFVDHRLPPCLPSPTSQEGIRVILGVITLYRTQVETSPHRSPSSATDVALSFLRDLALRFAPLLCAEVWRSDQNLEPLRLSEKEQEYLLRAFEWLLDWMDRYRSERTTTLRWFIKQLKQMVQEEETLSGLSDP